MTTKSEETKSTSKTTKKATKAEPKLKPAKSEDITEVEKKVNSVKSTTAKAGKRSKKAVEAEEAKEAKEQRKAAEKDEEVAKPTVKKRTPRVKKYSKNQKAARELIEVGKKYTIAEAVELLPKISKVKFDATTELHIRLGIDPRQADQQLRVSVVLPAGTGKSVRVAVLADDKLSAEAKKAGAEVVGAESILESIGKAKFDFDVLVATPDQMATLGKHAKVLGPKGLMPSPKSGTVTNEPAKTVEQIKKGRLELKNDANGIVHAGIGKLSFKPADLTSNIETAILTITRNKPTGVKGTFIRSIYLSSSMSPSIALDIASALDSKQK